MFISLFSWIIGEKPQWFFRIWNSTHIAHLRVIPKSFLCHFSESASTKHWKPSSLYAFKRNRAIVFQREHSHSIIILRKQSEVADPPWLTFAGFTGGLWSTPPVRNSSILSSSSPCYVSPYRCNRILEIKGFSLYAFVLNSQCIFPFL